MAEQDQNIANETVNIYMPDKIRLVAGRNPKRSGSLGRKMQKVPPLLRLEKNNQQDYDPQVVSLGPYHHGKTELQLAEDFKLTTLEMLLADSGKDVQFFYNTVLERVNDARNCYIEDSTDQFDDPTFAQMMLLDACFIIHFIATTKYPRQFYVRLHLWGDVVYARIVHDMFLLENQIPFWVLKLLICLGYGKDEGEEMLNEFLSTTVFGGYKRTGIAGSEREQEEPFHLLDALWTIFVSKCQIESSPSPASWSRCMRIGMCSKFHRCITKFPGLGWRRKHENEDSVEKYIHTFHSVTDLKAKGIHFRPSSANSLERIKFKSGCFYAELDVPIFFVSVYTKVFLLNMIAYEMSPSTTTDRPVTEYIDFMKSLIDSPKDTKELREKGILFTTLGSDEEVVKVYKEIKTYWLNNDRIFRDVKEEIQAHYNSWAKTWLAELLHTYFRSPWTIIALLAATFLLVLTFLQTYFTVNPVSGK